MSSSGGSTSWIKKGVKLLTEKIGEGADVERHARYVLAIRITLSKGEVVKPEKCISQTLDNNLKIREDGFLESSFRIDRENLIGGVFYAVDGMRVGGYRKVAIAPHLAYGEKGIPGVIPKNAKIFAEIKVLREGD